jgi:acetyl-CoA C-acetyltransferase
VSAVDASAPCIVGVGRRTWRDHHGDAPEPLDMCAEVARAAEHDSGCSTLLRSVDSIHAVHCASWAYDDFPCRIAQRLGLDIGYSEMSILAGTSGQRMIIHAAERMLRGESEIAMIIGAEALATKRRLLDIAEQPGWSHPAPGGGQPMVDLSEWTSATELAHQILAPSLTFALLDSARRATTGTDPSVYRTEQAELFATFNAVAAENPHAWLPTRRDAAEIATPTPQNRLISSPYTKYMVAIMTVDMAAAVIVTTHRRANELHIPHDRRIYLRGWSFGRDSTHLAERPFLTASPAMAEASRSALRHAQLDLDDINYFDLYSCFPASVAFATDALSLHATDPRALTVTGGLPYHGGPSSNYTTHAVAEIVHQLRSSGGHALVSGVGMHMTKHSWAVYSPTPGPVEPPDYRAVQARIDCNQPFHVEQQLDRRASGRIAACSVTHDRIGNPVSAAAIIDLAGRTRAYARSSDPATIALVEHCEPVGLAVSLRRSAPNQHMFHVDAS